MHSLAPPPRKGEWHEKLVRSGYFFGALLLHLVVFLMVATLVVWKAPVRPADGANFRKVSITVPPLPITPPAMGAAADNPQFEPQLVTVPVVTPPSMITTSNSTFSMDATKIINQALSHSSDLKVTGSGLGPSGGGADSGSGNNFFGKGAQGSALGFEGNFWDMKQTPDGQPNEMADNAFEQANPTKSDPNSEKLHSTQVERGILRDFLTDWNPQKLDEYYKAPETLSAPQLFIPAVPSPEAPRAFHVDKTVPSARRWIIVYKAKVIPPKTEDFRFIGFADDYMVVRIDEANVLDASYAYEVLTPNVDVREDVGPGPRYCGIPLRCGPWIHMQAGIGMQMQVLIGEDPGGASSFFLFVQEKGVDTPKGDYPVFQLQDVPVPDWTDRTIAPPKCTKKKMLFQLGS